MKDHILVSDFFYSAQGEGRTTGVPSYFIRATHCSLSCGASNNFLNEYKKDASRHDPTNFVGDLELENKSSWSCDSIPQWIKGENIPFINIIKEWEDQLLYDYIVDGIIHVIWTGGEPTLPITQKSIVEFLQFFKDYHSEKKIDHLRNRKERYPLTDLWTEKSITPFYEIETNGTCYINDELYNQLSQINCSPKLSNSGMEEKRRIIPEAIKRVLQHKNYQFKFVVSTEDDIKEMFETYVKPFNIPLKNLYCMPGMNKQEQFHERSNFIMEMAKKYKFTATFRAHISSWNRVLSV